MLQCGITTCAQVKDLDTSLFINTNLWSVTSISLVCLKTALETTKEENKYLWENWIYKNTYIVYSLLSIKLKLISAAIWPQRHNNTTGKPLCKVEKSGWSGAACWTNLCGFTVKMLFWSSHLKKTQTLNTSCFYRLWMGLFFFLTVNLLKHLICLLQSL